MSGRPLHRRVTGAVRRRTLGRRATPGEQDVPVAELVSPLRLDIVVRAQFFQLVDAHPAADADELSRLAGGSGYETWFRHVAMARYHPDVAADDARFGEAFTERVASAASLWRSFRARGFDPQYPITLRAPGPRTTLPPGKPVRRPLYMGDGCHRLALLVASGSAVVPAGLYRVEPLPLPAVIDNTAVLLPLLRPTEPEYARFLASGYGVDPLPTVAQVVEAVRQRVPGRADEAVCVASADGYQPVAGPTPRVDLP